MDFHSILSGLKVYYRFLRYTFESVKKALDFYDFLKKERKIYETISGI